MRRSFNRCRSGTLTTQYAYLGDPLRFTPRAGGTRLAQTVNGLQTRYTVNASGQLPQVSQEQQGSNVTRYLYGAGMLAVQYNGAWTYQHADALGSVRQTSNILGVVQQSADYDPFGNVIHAVGQPAGSFGFAREQQDAASGLTFLRARYYDPSIGRFLTRDTYPAYAPAPQTLHRYVYVENNPVNHTDPAGLMCVDEPGKLCHADRRMQQPVHPLGWLNDLYKWWTTRFGRDEDNAYRTRTVAVRHATSSDTEYVDRKTAETQTEVRSVATSVSRGDVRFAGGFILCTTCRAPAHSQWNEGDLVGCIACHYTIQLGHTPTNQDIADLEGRQINTLEEVSQVQSELFKEQLPSGPLGLLKNSPVFKNIPFLHVDLPEGVDELKLAAQSWAAGKTEETRWAMIRAGWDLSGTKDFVASTLDSGLSLFRDLDITFSNKPLGERAGPIVRTALFGTSVAVVGTWAGEALSSAIPKLSWLDQIPALKGGVLESWLAKGDHTTLLQATKLATQLLGGRPTYDPQAMVAWTKTGVNLKEPWVQPLIQRGAMPITGGSGAEEAGNVTSKAAGDWRQLRWQKLREQYNIPDSAQVQSIYNVEPWTGSARERIWLGTKDASGIFTSDGTDIVFSGGRRGSGSDMGMLARMGVADERMQLIARFPKTEMPLPPGRSLGGMTGEDALQYFGGIGNRTGLEEMIDYTAAKRGEILFNLHEGVASTNFTLRELNHILSSQEALARTRFLVDWYH